MTDFKDKLFILIDGNSADGSFFDNYTDEISFLGRDEGQFLEDILNVLNGVDLRPYLTRDFYLDYLADEKILDLLAEKPEEAEEEISADIGYYATEGKNYFVEALEHMDRWDGSLINEILANIDYEIGVVGYPDWTYALYPKSEKQLASDLWDGYDFYTVTLRDPSFDVINSTTIYHPTIIDDSVIENYAKELGADNTDPENLFVLQSHTSKFFELSKYKIVKPIV